MSNYKQVSLSDIDRRIAKVFCNRFGAKYGEVLNESTTMEDIKEWDSMSFLQLIVELEKEFELSFASHEAAQMFSYGNILRIIRGRLT